MKLLGLLNNLVLPLNDFSNSITVRVLQGIAPPYLGPLVPVRSLPGRRSLRSTSTSRLLVPPVKRSTVGSRAFLVAGPNS